MTYRFIWDYYYHHSRFKIFMYKVRVKAKNYITDHIHPSPALVIRCKPEYKTIIHPLQVLVKPDSWFANKALLRGHLQFQQRNWPVETARRKRFFFFF